MTYEQELDKIYQNSIDILNNTDKQIELAYRQSLENIETLIAKYRQDIESGRINPSARDFRAQALYIQVKQELDRLSGKTSGYIKTSWNKTYVDTYYYTGYIIEKDVNTQLIKKAANLFLNYPAPNKKAIEASFNTEIAGLLFKDRVKFHRDVLQWKVRQATASAIAEGISQRYFKKRLTALSDQLGFGKHNIETLSRTELLKAYSLGNEDINTAAIKSGVKFDYIWSSVASGNTRETHLDADRQKAKIVKGKPQFSVGGVLFTSPRIVSPQNTNGNTAKEVINCRCTRLDIPYGITPNVRVVKTRQGEWIEKPFNQTARDWIDKNYPQEVK